MNELKGGGGNPVLTIVALVALVWLLIAAGPQWWMVILGMAVTYGVNWLIRHPREREEAERKREEEKRNPQYNSGDDLASSFNPPPVGYWDESERNPNAGRRE